MFSLHPRILVAAGVRFFPYRQVPEHILHRLLSVHRLQQTLRATRHDKKNGSGVLVRIHTWT